MEVCAVQLDIRWEDKAANCRRVERVLAGGGPRPGGLIVLPEMFATGFTMNTAGMSESPSGAIHAWLRGFACRHWCWVVAGVACGGDGACTNEAWVYSPSGRRRARYAKMHLFRPGNEARHYAPGSRICRFRSDSLRVVPFICYDLRFPELFRLGKARGAEVFVVIASWPDRRQDHWRTLLRARAIENQAFVVGVNRCGRDPHHCYAGGSMVVGPRGDVLAEAGSRESVLRATLDATELRRWRREFPALADRRIRVGRGVKEERRE